MNNKSKPTAPTAHGTVTRAQFLNLFAAVFVPMFMAAADQTLLATATPAIAGSLGGLRDSAWIAVAYLLSSAVIIPMYGRLGDIRGKRHMLLIALGVFCAGSLACAAAQTMPQLIAARVLQGLGGGGLMMLSQALIGELVPPVERIRFQSWFAIVYTTASVGGPVIGGLVVAHTSWRWLFLANLPLAAFAAWRLSRLPQGERHPQPGGRTDIPGHALFAIGALSLLFWLTSAGHRFTWLSGTSGALFLVAFSSLLFLAWHERRHVSPFLPVELFREKTIRLTSALVAIFAACMFATVFFLPIYLQLGYQVRADVSGLLLLPVTAGQVIGNVGCTRILRHTGNPYPVQLTGMALASFGLSMLALLPPGIGVVAAFGFMVGLGLGTIMPTSQLVVQTVAGRTRLGAATATLSLSRSTGGAAGAALFGAVVFAALPDLDRHSLVEQAGAIGVERITDAFHRAFFCTAAVAALGTFIASRMPRVSLWQPGDKPG